MGILVSYPHFLPESLISSLPGGILNAHPSLLPKWRGPAPLDHFLLSGESESGISIMELNHQGWDQGRLLAQFPIVSNFCSNYRNSSTSCGGSGRRKFIWEKPHSFILIPFFQTFLDPSFQDQLLESS